MADDPGLRDPPTVIVGRPSISIVVNTNGRAESLRKTLESFRWLDYPDFEVCVVVGPAEDGSHQVVREYVDRGEVKYARCAAANLSMSRNIGIQIAAGEVVAFIDDDAVPEPEWLRELAPAFADPAVGGAGGVTYDHTGYSFQAQYILCDRFGDAQFYSADPGVGDYCFPFSGRYPSLMGTNSAFRRRALVNIGGFDEEFEYYLDETDVCSRVIDSGFLVRELPGAPVHHKFLPSHLRNEHRFLRTSFSVLKNKTYFAVLNSRTHHGIDEAIKNTQSFFARRRGDIVWGMDNGRVSGDALSLFDEEADRAWRVGMARGMDGRRRTRPRDWFGHGEPFQAFPTLRPAGGARTFVFLSQNYPPGDIAGNARHTTDIARAIAAVGHNVHVLTAGREFDRVDLEDGVWVHRIVPRHHEPRRLPDGQIVPAHIWNYSATMLEEAQRISRSRRIDVVEGVSWDCETAAFVLDGRFPVATNIVTSLAHWLETHPEQADDRRWLNDFGRPMMALEKIVYEESDRTIAASEAIVEALRERYEVALDASVVRCPHGLGDMRPLPGRRPVGLDGAESGLTKILFVGRLELRKGIDTLLASAARLLDDGRDLEFWIAGENSLETGGGTSEQQKFLASETGRRIGERVRFIGPVDDSELRWLYANCDVFVAPSRFESFGLIYVEAMMFAKPVVGCRAGGVGEVVIEGETGLLVPPGDAAALAKAISVLAGDRELRQRLGAAGRADYERRFAAPVVAHSRIELLLDVARRPLAEDRLDLQGEIRPVDVGDEHGLFLEPDARLTYSDVSGALFITFLCHDWGGVAQVELNGAPHSEQDLYSASRKTRTVRIDAPEGGSIAVARTNRKHPRSQACEVIVLSAQER